MIDPQDIVREYTDDELEELLIFTICVAGKTAKTIAPRVSKLCNMDYSDIFGWKYRGIFERMSILNQLLGPILKQLGIGCYTAKAETILEVSRAGLDLRTCTVEDLMAIKGIGPKTAKAFIMWSRPNEKHAIIDTHILKWLKAQGVSNVPTATPTAKNYARLEQEFLSRVPNGMTPAEFDLEIWKKYSNAKRTKVSST